MLVTSLQYIEDLPCNIPYLRIFILYSWRSYLHCTQALYLHHKLFPNLCWSSLMFYYSSKNILESLRSHFSNKLFDCKLCTRRWTCPLCRANLSLNCSIYLFRCYSSFSSQLIFSIIIKMFLFWQTLFFVDIFIMFNV